MKRLLVLLALILGGLAYVATPAHATCPPEGSTLDVSTPVAGLDHDEQRVAVCTPVQDVGLWFPNTGGDEGREAVVEAYWCSATWECSSLPATGVDPNAGFDGNRVTSAPCLWSIVWSMCLLPISAAAGDPSNPWVDVCAQGECGGGFGYGEISSQYCRTMPWWPYVEVHNTPGDKGVCFGNGSTAVTVDVTPSSTGVSTNEFGRTTTTTGARVCLWMWAGGWRGNCVQDASSTSTVSSYTYPGSPTQRYIWVGARPCVEVPLPSTGFTIRKVCTTVSTVTAVEAEDDDYQGDPVSAGSVPTVCLTAYTDDREASSCYMVMANAYTYQRDESSPMRGVIATASFCQGGFNCVGPEFDF